MNPAGPLTDLEQRIATLEAAVGFGTPQLKDSAQAPGALDRTWAEAALLLGLPLALLLAAHYVLIIVLSHVSAAYLLAASVTLPLPFAFLAAARAVPRLSRWFVLGFAMALAATLGMSGVTAMVDDVAWLPQTRRDAIELAAFTCSIGLSHAAGLILGRMFRRRNARQDEVPHAASLSYRVARRLLGPRYAPDRAHKATIALIGVLRLAAAGATIAGSVYSGWQRFFG